MLVPKLRFKREDGTSYPEWNKDKWSDLGDFIASGTLSKSNLSDTGTPCILYGELYTKYREVAHTIYSKTNSVSHIFSKADDVILPKSGETPEDISTATCVPYDNISLGGDLIIFRHNEKVIGTYLSYLISNRAKNAIASIAQGKSVVHISEKSLSNIELSYPHPEEQQKIADFLSTVDEVISYSEAEVRNLEQQKKAAMQKIFSQKVRFKREDGTVFPDWEEKKLSEIGHFYGGLSGKSKDDFGTGLSKYITYMNINKNMIIRNDILESVNIDNDEKQNTVEYGDLVFTQSSETVDECGLTSVYLYEDKPYLNSFCMGFRLNSFEQTLPLFTAYLMRSKQIRKQIMVNSQGISRINLSGNRILKMLIHIPCLEEQQKIADFLSAYDEAISYAKQELEHWKQLKKGLLQQMFI